MQHSSKDMLKLRIAAGAMLMLAGCLAAPAVAKPFLGGPSIALLALSAAAEPVDAAAQRAQQEEDQRQIDEELAQQARDQEAYDTDLEAQRQASREDQAQRGQTLQAEIDQALAQRKIKCRELWAAWRADANAASPGDSWAQKDLQRRWGELSEAGC